MEYTMGTKLVNISLEMKIVKMLCKINEYKGQQILYKKQPKNVVSKTTDEAISNFVYDTYIDKFSDNKEKLIKLINNEIKPSSRSEISVLEFRDVIKTVNSAYEDIKLCSQTILELHGYLHRYSLVRGGRYRDDEVNMEMNIENEVENICKRYYELIEEGQVQDLIIIASFIIDFILIAPFKEDNIKMAKILTLLLLNKSNYEIGRFNSLGEFFEAEKKIYFRNLFSRRGDFERESYNMNKWLDYFLSFILNAYEDLSDSTNITAAKKETKTKRIEKVINSTLGYFTKDDIRNQCPDIPEPTINRVFNNLRKCGKIEVVAKGRSAKWKKR